MLDKYKIRDNNERIVMKHLLLHQPISRASLSKLTKLNKSTVTEIVNTLLERNLVVEIGLGNSKVVGGRKPVLLSVNEQAGYVIAIDLGNTYFKAILSDLNHHIVDEISLKDLIVDRSNTIGLITDAITQFDTIASQSEYGIVGTVIAVHGVVHDNHVTLSPNYNMRGLHLSDRLNELYDFPIFIENEANLAAIGHINLNHDVNNLIVLSVHTGIGGGIIINRELYSGYQGAAGELGHITLYPNGHACQCQKLGCFEQYCSTQVILNTYAKAKQQSSSTLQEFVKAYQIGDNHAREIMDAVLSDMAVGINTIVSSFNPEIIYVINEIMDDIPGLVDVLAQKVEAYALKPVDIVLSEIPYGATLSGAITVGINQFLDIDQQIN